jgi:hypothetical protein
MSSHRQSRGVCPRSSTRQSRTTLASVSSKMSSNQTLMEQRSTRQRRDVRATALARERKAEGSDGLYHVFVPFSDSGQRCVRLDLL